MTFSPTPHHQAQSRLRAKHHRKGFCKKCGNKAQRGRPFCRPCGARSDNPEPDAGYRTKPLTADRIPVEQVHDIEPRFTKLAEAAGLQLDTRYHWRGGRCSHWMFNDSAGRRVVDYWPSTGRWWCPRTGERGQLPVESEEIIAIALARK